MRLWPVGEVGTPLYKLYNFKFKASTTDIYRAGLMANISISITSLLKENITAP